LPNANATVGIAKSPTGIEGFDYLTGGGLPKGRIVLVTGEPGAGKTIFALQMLVSGATLYSEPGIFVAFEERSKQIIANAASFGWKLSSLQKDKLFFLDVHIPPDVHKAGKFDLGGILAGLEAKAKERGAKRIVFDGIDVFLSHLGDPESERSELFRLYSWLADQGLTAIFTGKTEPGGPSTSDTYGFMQYMVDCVVQLSHQLFERVSARELRVTKYRGSAFLENSWPMCIGPSGIEVGSIISSNLDFPVSSERVSTGIQRLDTLLGGGYFRGTGILISGNPGTAKTTLAGAFLEDACKRGERSLYLGFEEAGGEIVRNLSSVNIQLGPHIKSGALGVHSVHTDARSAEEHLMVIKSLIRRHKARNVVVDPLSALTNAGGASNALSVAQRLMRFVKSEGITAIFTSLLTGKGSEIEGTSIQISSIADTWMHLSYVAQIGERNRALSIIKSRGTKHSNQVRELVLADTGVTLADVYLSGGTVLMGAARIEKEQTEKRETSQRELDRARKLRELSILEAETNAKIRALRQVLQARQEDLKEIQLGEAAEENQRAELQRGLREHRGGDADDAVVSARSLHRLKPRARGAR
jgi:circadian clock protein KaiC